MKGSPSPRHQRGVSLPQLAEAAPDVAADAIRPGATLAELFRAHANDVARWAHRLGGPLVDAEDVVQEVFLVAHRRLPEFRYDATPSTWLFRITHNVVRHRRRKDRLRRWLTGTAEEQAEREPSDERSAPERIESRESAAALYRVLDQMSERNRTVLVLFELEELSGEQIAQLLGAKTATVWVWLHRARADFLKRMQAEVGS